MRPHDVLGVRPNAGPAEVTDAFRRYVLRHHPDHGGDPASFQAGVDAYHLLSRRRPESVDVVFHHRSRPGVASLLRVARRRLFRS